MKLRKLYLLSYVRLYMSLNISHILELLQIHNDHWVIFTAKYEAYAKGLPNALSFMVQKPM